MTCACSDEAIECMTLPGVADLCCPTSGCCTPALSLDGMADGLLEAFDDGGGPAFIAAGGAPEAVDFLQSYVDAIELAAKKLANSVCMAKYAADCQICFTVCVPYDCRCTCACDDCDICAKEHIRIDEIAGCVHHTRVLSAETSAGDPVGFNGSDDTATYQIVARRGDWRLYGPAADNGGRVTICLTLKPAALEWNTAVLSMACSRVKCGHADGCARDEYTVSETNDGISRTFLTKRDQIELGLLGDRFADDLDRECCNQTGYRFGRASRVETIRWEPDSA